ncbi:MAG TPA: Wzz/FepE/Etk N-terminal domain-containing protein [Bacteroidales bacterium]|nr:Wzz/FepE/Etk N-terminal domain-containing protein [Bacteroidales bacterium]
MGKKKKSKYNFDSTNLFVYVYKNFKILFLVSLLAMIVSVIVSLVITPKFKSEVVLFPVASEPVAQTLLATNGGNTEGIVAFGEDEDAERLLQVLKSEEIRDRIVQKYNLMEHYEIDTSSKYPQTQLYEKYKSNISFKRTEYQSIDIDVLDEDPVIAANIANDIAALIDSTMNRMKHERAQKGLIIVKKAYNDLREQIAMQEDSLDWIRKQGLNDYESMAEVLNDAYANALLENNEVAAKKIQAKLDLVSKYGNAYVSIRDYLEFEKKQLSELKAKYTQAQVEATQDLPHKFIVDKAYPAEKKTYPIRSLIVIISTLSAFLLALIMLIIIDTVKNKI